MKESYRQMRIAKLQRMTTRNGCSWGVQKAAMNQIMELVKERCEGDAPIIDQSIFAGQSAQAMTETQFATYLGGFAAGQAQASPAQRALAGMGAAQSGALYGNPIAFSGNLLGILGLLR